MIYKAPHMREKGLHTKDQAHHSRDKAPHMRDQDLHMRDKAHHMIGKARHMKDGTFSMDKDRHTKDMTLHHMDKALHSLIDKAPLTDKDPLMDKANDLLMEDHHIPLMIDLHIVDLLRNMSPHIAGQHFWKDLQSRIEEVVLQIQELIIVATHGGVKKAIICDTLKEE